MCLFVFIYFLYLRSFFPTTIRKNNKKNKTLYSLWLVSRYAYSWNIGKLPARTHTHTHTKLQDTSTTVAAPCWAAPSTAEADTLDVLDTWGRDATWCGSITGICKWTTGDDRCVAECAADACWWSWWTSTDIAEWAGATVPCDVTAVWSAAGLTGVITPVGAWGVLTPVLEWEVEVGGRWRLIREEAADSRGVSKWWDSEGPEYHPAPWRIGWI